MPSSSGSRSPAPHMQLLCSGSSGLVPLSEGSVESVSLPPDGFVSPESDGSEESAVSDESALSFPPEDVSALSSSSLAQETNPNNNKKQIIETSNFFMPTPLKNQKNI